MKYFYMLLFIITCMNYNTSQKDKVKEKRRSKLSIIPIFRA